ncbi:MULTISPECIES: acyloxyacyl hydrolase [unclassified Arenibacter]|uniref:acyloxyacyl hydrolase n=1 Tax=unclassified Arenibacter TaxID=2615047 RepID=UPI000E341D69|nr:MULTISPECIES: acyloxyacyl hydrolase [unclassified Arenibacter]MCM4164381.1 deacylase [Arenibacter sp. A80]RFT56159.1 acyloxyacyl hydrolase [Arenibacter sp. P308M17]
MNLRLFLIGCLSTAFCFSQNRQETKRYTLDVSQFYGSVLLHNPDISHLITNHPGGIILGYNRKTYGDEEWQQRYNYPDTGFSFVYQNMNNSTLGENFGLYAHYNFYFFKRNLQFRLGQGIAYNTNPFDKNENFRNNAYGSHFLSSTYLMLNYHKENMLKGLGFKAGISLIHYSNANVTAPNTSTNTMALNVGLTYDLDGGEEREYIRTEKVKLVEPIKLNLAFRSGINESDVVDSGQYAFYIFSAYVDKRFTRRSALQLGTEVYFSNFLKELIRYQSVAFPEYGVQPDDDYKRVGVFMGHELFINKMSVIAQLGYYVYYPFDFEGKVYNRIGLKRYFSNKVYGAISLKSHGAKAEAVEFGVGVRL